MNFKLVFRLAGKTLLVEAASMILPLCVALLLRWLEALHIKLYYPKRLKNPEVHIGK